MCIRPTWVVGLKRHTLGVSQRVQTLCLRVLLEVVAEICILKKLCKFHVGGPRTTLRFVARWLEDDQIIEVKKS